jgi:hypothetical protein
MKERVVRTEIVRLAGPCAVLEIQFVAPAPRRRWRRWIALKLVQLAGRIAGMSVRIVPPA